MPGKNTVSAQPRRPSQALVVNADVLSNIANRMRRMQA